MVFPLKVKVYFGLTHWGHVMHICVSKLNIIGSDDGLSPGRHLAIIWISDGILLIVTLETNFNENLNWNLYIFIQENAFEKVVWKTAAILSRSQCVKLILSSGADSSCVLKVFGGLHGYIVWVVGVSGLPRVCTAMLAQVRLPSGHVGHMG